MRRSGWKILAVAASGIAILVGAAALWIRSTADRKIAAMEERLRALEAEALAPDPTPRPGKVPGNAWDDYLAALNEASKLQSPDKLIGILAGTKNAEVAFGDTALAAHGLVVDRIVSGSRRASCLPPGRTALPGLWRWETVIRLAILRARSFQKEGKTGEAIEILLALCRFGRDLGESGLAYAAHFPYPAMEMAMEELQDLLRAGPLSGELIAGIDSHLADLDARFPLPERLRKQNLQLIAELNAPSQNHAFGAAILSWRFGFSPRLLAGSMFEQWEHWLLRSSTADGLPWPQAKSLIGTLREEIDQTRFMGRLYDLPSPFLQDGSQVRATRAHLRLLRTVARYRATGKVLELDDPFGTKLLHQESGGRLKVWSVGVDGVDQQGFGGWSSRPGEDIVLDVPR